MNGFAGVDFLEADADGYARAGEALLETGVTALPADLHHRARGRTSSPRSRERAARAGGPADPRRPPRGPVPLADAARHPSASARRDPDPALLERLLAAGPVRLMTLAPELPGALELIDLLLGARHHRLAAGTPTRRPSEANARLRPRRRAPSRTSSTRCARSATATRGSSARRSRAPTSSSR